MCTAIWQFVEKCNGHTFNDQKFYSAKIIRLICGVMDSQLEILFIQRMLQRYAESYEKVIPTINLGSGIGFH